MRIQICLYLGTGSFLNLSFLDSSLWTDPNEHLLCTFNSLFAEEDAPQYLRKLSGYPEKVARVDAARQGEKQN